MGKSISEAIISGQSFSPSEFPTVSFSTLSSTGSLVELAFEALAPYFVGDPLFSALPEVCYEAFDFPIELVNGPLNCKLLELFHGDGGSSADLGASFLSGLLSRLSYSGQLIAEAKTPKEVDSFRKAFGDKVVINSGSKEGIPVDYRNTAFILGQSVAFIYAAMHEAMTMDAKYHSKEIFLSNFIIPATETALLEAVSYARSIGAPIGKVTAVKLDDSALINQSLEDILVQSVSEDEINKVLENAQFPMSRATAACEAVRNRCYPVHQSIIVVSESPLAK